METVANVRFYEEFSELWAGMHVHKWLTNSPKVLKRIPTESRASVVLYASTRAPMVKTLGVAWLTQEVVFTLISNSSEKDLPFIKRNFLKKIGKVFYLIGFLAPFIIRAKIFKKWGSWGWTGTIYSKQRWLTKQDHGCANWRIYPPLRSRGV